MNLQTVQLKVFVPSGANFPRTRQFFLALGFQENWSVDGLCELQMGMAIFLLQAFHNQSLQENFVMYLTVENLDDWWLHLQSSGVLEHYADDGVKATPPTVFPWGGREIHLIDPAGVCWHIAGLNPD